MSPFGWLLYSLSALALCWWIILVSKPGWAIDLLEKLQMSLLTGVGRVTSRSGTRDSAPVAPTVYPSSNVRLVPEYELIARSSSPSDGLDDGTPSSWLAVSPDYDLPY